MSATPYVSHQKLGMRAHPLYNERWLQERIIEEPTLLGLGELDVLAVERIQPRAGRLDLLLIDRTTNTRYEVELQLGGTDESHIIRTIEYWDLERRRYPQYDHVAVIVAEQITARFFNVISLFNGFIPIVAVQVSLLEVNGAVTLAFTTVLDRTELGLVEDEETDTTPTDRAYWEQRSSPATVAVTDLLLRIVQKVEPGTELNYNRSNIGVTVGGVAANFVRFFPRKRAHVLVRARAPRSDDLIEQLEDSSLNYLSYTRGGAYSVQVADDDIEANEELLTELFRRARDSHIGTDTSKGPVIPTASDA